ncbi:MAG: hypothetical protein ACRCVG_05330 [Methanobacteriaceae archaeon]
MDFKDSENNNNTNNNSNDSKGKNNNSNNYNNSDSNIYENKLKEIDPDKLGLINEGPLTDEEFEELKEKLGLDFEELDFEEALEEMDFLECPEIGIETDDFFVSLNLKKDYSQISDLNERKIQLISDIHFLFDEFSKTPDFDDLMKFYDEFNEKEDSQEFNNTTNNNIENNNTNN